ncbi:class I SAM-dependent methyltransferase [Salmonirosea aquatica]|uniref:Methyltransferase domain-containing protein n=1 Tax=Salmonirosea aquatica TaxID=2654236 RepID=A0A7C9BGP1_9BACT|nr:methyltransferase domain-containing protein [Cytophagaceae bacterium SJW1-29]
MKLQKDIFLNTEGDQWYLRNKEHYSLSKQEESLLIKSLKTIEAAPAQVLEIGCSNGTRLNDLQHSFGSECHGVDPSSVAIEEGNTHFPALRLQVGTADSLPFQDNQFDLVIFGFCLYLCDRRDLFKIAAEADRCLMDGGLLAITDFQPPFAYRNGYSHREGMFSYKMNYAKMFSWNPAYNEIYTVVTSHAGFSKRDVPDEKVAVTLLSKNESFAYPTEPYK